MLRNLTLAGLLALPACGQVEPRSVQYFEAHLDEAKTVVASCQQGSSSGDECANAGTAVKVDEDRKRFARFRGK